MSKKTAFYKKIVFISLVISNNSQANNGVGWGLLTAFEKYGLGIQGQSMPSSDWGWYGDIKASMNGSNASGVSKMTADNLFHDPLVERKIVLTIFDIGRTKKVFENTWAYMGMGLSTKRTLYRYFDNTGILSPDGNYWVEGGTEIELNLCSGVQLTIPERNMYLTIGYDSVPSAISFGFGGIY